MWRAILVTFLQGLVVGSESLEVKAGYEVKLRRLTLRVFLHYGQGLQQTFSPQLDFNYDRLVLTDKAISKHGAECPMPGYCTYDLANVTVPDNSARRELIANKGVIVFGLSPGGKPRTAPGESESGGLEDPGAGDSDFVAGDSEQFAADSDFVAGDSEQFAGRIGEFDSETDRSPAIRESSESPEPRESLEGGVSSGLGESGTASCNFYYKMNTIAYREKNVLGLSPWSPIWRSFLFLTGKDSVTFLLRIETRLTNAQAIVNNPSEVRPLIRLGDMPRLADFYIQPNSESAFFYSISMKLEGYLQEGFQAAIDPELPHFFSLSFQFYQLLLKQIHARICLDPRKCQAASDLDPRRDRSQKLYISFLKDQDFSQRQFSEGIDLEDLYYVDPSGKLLFNFSTASEGGEYFTISLGILFLRRFDFFISHVPGARKFSLILANRSPELGALPLFLLIASALIAFVITKIVLKNAKKLTFPAGISYLSASQVQ